MSRGAPPAWLAQIADRLGTVPDRQLADEVGVEVRQVRDARFRRGIRISPEQAEEHRKIVAAGVPPSAPEPEHIAALRREVEAMRAELALRKEIAELRAEMDALNTPPAQTRTRHPVRDALDAVRDRIGKVSDSIIAKELDISEQTVWAYRKKHGIPPAHETTGRKAEYPWADRLGKEPDSVIARDVGLSRTRVNQVRIGLGIPSFRTKTLE